MQAPTEVKTQAIQEAVVDAVEAASTAAEVEEKPATAVTTVEETKVGDDVIMETAVATGEGQGVQESAAPASDAPAAEAAKSPAIVQTYRLFVGCVPTQMNEKELSESFTGVSLCGLWSPLLSFNTDGHNLCVLHNLHSVSSSSS